MIEPIIGIVSHLQIRKSKLVLLLKEYPSEAIIEKVAGSQLKFEYRMLQEEIKYIDGKLEVYLSPVEDFMAHDIVKKYKNTKNTKN